MIAMILAACVKFGVPLALTVLSALTPQAFSWLRSKTKGSKYGVALEKLTTVVETVVHELAQTIVPELISKSANGTLTKEDAVAVKTLALAKVQAYLGESGIKEVAKALGIPDNVFTQFLVSRIEQAVLAISVPSLGAKVVTVVAPPMAPALPVTTVEEARGAG